MRNTRNRSAVVREPRWLERALVAIAIATVLGLVLLPMAHVFAQALARGFDAYVAAVSSPHTLAAAGLTALAVAVAVPVNLLFGLAAAWLVAKFRFRGKSALVALFDLPFAVSPVVAGLAFVLVFGKNGWLGGWLAEHDLKVIFATPGILLATCFVTFPFVVREVLPIMEAQGSAEEESALTLGASAWTVFTRITLPKISSGVLHGIVLSAARAMGEFGAVSVVSGHIRGRTNTLPLHAEILFNEYDLVGAFAVASLLTLVALVALAAKKLIELESARAPRASREPNAPVVRGSLIPAGEIAQ